MRPLPQPRRSMPCPMIIPLPPITSQPRLTNRSTSRRMHSPNSKCFLRRNQPGLAPTMFAATSRGCRVRPRLWRRIHSDRLAGAMRKGSRNAGRRPRLTLGVLELHRALVGLEELAELVNLLEQPDPLFVVEGDWKAPQAIHAHAALFADSEFNGATLSPLGLFFKLRQFRFQLFVGWFSHRRLTSQDS